MRILVPLDGSLLAESALGIATGLARLWPAEILLVRVVDPHASLPAGAMGLGRQAHDGEQESATDSLERMARQLTRWGVHGSTRVMLGQAVGQICRLAREEQVDLICLTSHGRSGPGRWLLGSVAEGVLRLAPCPVLLCRGSVKQDFRGFARVIVPSDGSPNSADVLPQLARYLHPEARLVLVRATDDLLRLSSQRFDPESYRAYLEALDEELAGLGPYERRVVDATPAQAILDTAEAEEADLIAMCTHGRTGFHRLMLGSVTERVARHAACPVLAFPARVLASTHEPAERREALPL